MSVNAEALIVGDLRALRRSRGRHFVPALALGPVVEHLMLFSK